MPYKRPVNGYSLLQSDFKINPTDFEVSKKSVLINSQMPKNTLDLIQKNVSSYKDKSVLILGLTYREDVQDTRYSPSLKLIEYFGGILKKFLVMIQCLVNRS